MKAIEAVIIRNYFKLQMLDQMNASITIPNFNKNGSANLRIEIAMAAKFIGNMQYPSTQTLCKNDTFPPNIFALIVTIIAPPQIKMNMTPFIRIICCTK